MDLAASSFQTVTENSKAFTEAGAALAALIGTLNEQRSQIEASIQSLGELLSNASTAIPQIERNVLQLTEQMTFGVNQHQQAITAALSDGSKTLQGASSEMKAAMISALQEHNQESNNHIRQ
jgi:ABC-type transporter Mla subunit MlaD